jgi:hypothetical protein
LIWTLILKSMTTTVAGCIAETLISTCPKAAAKSTGSTRTTRASDSPSIAARLINVIGTATTSTPHYYRKTGRSTTKPSGTSCRKKHTTSACDTVGPRFQSYRRERSYPWPRPTTLLVQQKYPRQCARGVQPSAPMRAACLSGERHLTKKMYFLLFF